MPAPLPRSPQELFYEDRHFHEGCFRCYRCQRSLADEPFTCQDSEQLPRRPQSRVGSLSGPPVRKRYAVSSRQVCFSSRTSALLR